MLGSLTSRARHFAGTFDLDDEEAGEFSVLHNLEGLLEEYGTIFVDGD